MIFEIFNLPLLSTNAMTLHDVLNPGVEGEHKFPPHSGKQMIFSSSNQFNCHGSLFRGSGSSRESGCTGGGGGSIAVQVKGGDYYCQ